MKYRKPSACILAFSLTGLLTAHSASGQTGTDRIDDLRRKSELTSDELQALDRYFEELVSRAAKQVNNPRAGRRLQEAIVASFNQSANNPRFKQLFAQRCSAQFAGRLPDAPEPLALSMVQTLMALSSPETLEALKAAMNSPHPAVRFLSAASLDRMASGIEADPAQVTVVLQWLTESAGKEKNGVVLARVYQAIDFGTKRDEQAVTLLNILSNRIQMYDADAVTAEEAELTAYARLYNLADLLSDAEKKRLVRLLARYLVYYTHRYVYADLAQPNRESLQRLLFMLERLLIRVTGMNAGNGGFAQAMGVAGQERYTQVRSALVAWVGAAGNGNQNGLLTASPWQIPVGGGVPDLDFAAPVPAHGDELAASTEGTP